MRLPESTAEPRTLARRVLNLEDGSAFELRYRAIQSHLI